MMKYPFLFLLVIAVSVGRAQSPGARAWPLFRGIQIDSPQVFLPWNSLFPDTAWLADHPNFREIAASRSRMHVRWDSTVVFGLGVDSMFLAYLRNGRQGHLLRIASLFFDTGLAGPLKDTLTRYLGPPGHSISKNGNYYAEWRGDHLLVEYYDQRNFHNVKGRGRRVYLLMAPGRIDNKP